MEFPKGNRACGCHRSLSTQTCDCQLCSGLNQEICGLCGNRVPSVSLSNEILIGNTLPENVCQCFLSTYSEVNVPEKADVKNEQKTELPIVQISQSQNFDLSNPVKEEESCMVEEPSNTPKKDDVKDSEKSKTPEFSNSSNGYALSLDDQSDRNFSDHRNITSPSSGGDSKSSSNLGMSKIDSEYEGGDSEEYKRNDSSLSTEEHKHIKKIRKAESSNSEYMMEIGTNKNKQHERAISTQPGNFGFKNQNIVVPILRPVLPRPFPHPYPQPYQPYINPAMNMQVPKPFPQMYQPYINPVLNVPINQTNIPGRFSVTSRPQLGTSCHHQPNIEGCATSFSKKLLAHTQELDSKENRIKTIERVESWLDKVECNPPDEEPSASDWASGWEQAENEQAIFGISTDERSSTELSEEENRKQRSSRRRPRNTKRNRPK